MSRFGKDVDKFVATLLASQKQAHAQNVADQHADELSQFYKARQGLYEAKAASLRPMDPEAMSAWISSHRGGGAGASGGSIGGDVPVKDIYSAFLGVKKSDGTALSPAQAKALTAEVGRETGFAAKNLYGTHTDAANGKTNFGFLSFQKDRLDSAKKYLADQGLIDSKTGNAIPGAKTNQAFAQFIVNDIENGKGYGLTREKFLDNPNVSPVEAAQVLGKNYIGWRIDDPKYRDAGINRLQSTYAQLDKELRPDATPRTQPTAAPPPRFVENKYNPIQTDAPTAALPRTAFDLVQPDLTPDKAQETASALPTADAPLPPRRPNIGPAIAESAPSSWAPPQEIQAKAIAEKEAADAAAQQAAEEDARRAKITEGWKSPQAALEDTNLYGDEELAAKGGLIGAAKTSHPYHRIVGEALNHIQDSYGLRASGGGAIDPEYDQSIARFHANSNSVSPQMMDALLNHVNPHGDLPDATTSAIHHAYNYYAKTGNHKVARAVAGGLMEAARGRSMSAGQRALQAHQARDYPAAARNVIAAYNEIPDGHTFTGEVNHAGFGSGVIANTHDNTPVQHIPFNPEVIGHAANTLASGSGFYPHMARYVHAASGGMIINKYEGAGLVDGLAASEDEPTAAIGSADYDPYDSSTTPISDRIAVLDDANGALTTPTQAALPSENLDISGVNTIPYHPQMNAAQRKEIDAINKQMIDEYKMNKRQEQAKERIGIRQEASKEAVDQRRNQAMHTSRMKDDSEYAFRNYNADLIDAYKKAEGVDKLTAASDLMDARYNHEAGSIKTTAKERDPEQVRAIIDDTWNNKLNNLAEQSKDVRRADGTPMTDVTKRTYYNFDGLPGAKRRFMDVAYNVVPMNDARHSPETVMSAIHDMAFKKFKDGEGPEIDDKTGKVKYDGISLTLNSEQYNALRKLRSDALLFDKNVSEQNKVKRQQAIDVSQNHQNASSMVPTTLSPDQQYAVKYGLNPNTNPDEVDRQRQWGAL